MTNERPQSHSPAPDRAVELLRELEQLRTTEPAVAKPLERLVARLLDFVCIALVFLVFSWLAFGVELAIKGGEAFEDASTRVDLSSRQEPSRTESAVSAAATILVLVGYETATSARRGQTLGKRIMGLRLVDSRTRAKPGVGRTLIRTLLWATPLSVAGSFWFSTLLSWLWLLLLLAMWGWILRHGQHRSLYDVLAGTAVVCPRQ